MSKNILLLTSTWDGEYNIDIIAGILERIGDDDMELHIFNAYDAGMDTDYYKKGREIYKLPVPARYDGMIIALSTLDSVKYVSELTREFRKYNKPVVSIDIRTEDAIFCGLDNYRSMYQLVEHMITIHDCRTFNYVGGPEEHEEASERYRAFCDCLAAHGIRVEKKRVLHKKFMKSDGRGAYNEFKEMGANISDAVICANDFMALGYLEEAAKDGITAPDFIKVTGFDNIDEAQRYYPSITSVNRNRKALGFESMDALIEALDGNSEYDTRFVEGYISYNESCGCDLTRDLRTDYNEVIEITRRELELGLRQSYSRQILFKCRSMDDYGKAIARIDELLDIGKAAICLNRSFFEDDPDKERNGFDEKMIQYYNGDRQEIDRNEKIYPEEWNGKCRVFIFSSLRSSNQTYGYVVMPYRDDFFKRLKHRNFIESVALSLHNINLRIEMNRIRNKESDITI